MTYPNTRTHIHALHTQLFSLPLRTLAFREKDGGECGGRKAITVISRGRTRASATLRRPSSLAAVVANGSHL